MMDRRASSALPLIVLFGAILAFLMAFVFITLYSQQLDLRVDEQAGALANDLAQTAFTALSGGQPVLELPTDVGGSPYAIEVQENSIFVVEITGGRMAGNSYSAVVNATVTVENRDFSQGGHMYFMRSGDQIIVSATPIEAPTENIAPVPTSEPPDFYSFAKENPKAATAIIASYFFALENHPEIDVTAYGYEGDNVLVQLTSRGENLSGVRVAGYEDNDNVGVVDNAWIVENMNSTENLSDMGDLTIIPFNLSENVENVFHSGWLYSPSQVLDHLRSRTWRLDSDAMVVVPSNATISAASATTNFSTYVTWRVEWESDNHYVVHYRAMPWWEKDNEPGFVFQSEPELKPVI